MASARLQVSGSWLQPVGSNDFPRRLTPPSSRGKIVAASQSSAGAAAASDAACPSDAFCFTDKAAMGATL